MAVSTLSQLAKLWALFVESLGRFMGHAAVVAGVGVSHSSVDRSGELGLVSRVEVVVVEGDNVADVLTVDVAVIVASVVVDDDVAVLVVPDVRDEGC
jgi:hypothetical protein